jgi:hypothetical protein
MSLLGDFISGVINSPATQAAAANYLGGAIPNAGTINISGFIPSAAGSQAPSGTVSVGGASVSYGSGGTDSKLLWIIGGVLFLVFGGVLIAIFSKKKRRK